MKWTRLCAARLRSAKMVPVSWAAIHREEANPMAQQMSVLGIDIAKLIFHVVGMGDGCTPATHDNSSPPADGHNRSHDPGPRGRTPLRRHKADPLDHVEASVPQGWEATRP
jgi:hypothetical protein